MKIKYINNNYIIYQNLLGKGTFSQVYQGIIRKNQKRVAIKISLKKYNRLQLFALKKLKGSKHIVNFIDYWTQKQNIFYVIQLCKTSLKNYLTQKNNICLQQKIKFIQQIIFGVNQLHQKKFVHRDLKLQNVLLDFNNNIKITDFGLVSYLQDNQTVYSYKNGTPITMPPQVYYGNRNNNIPYNYKTDVWSLCIIMHQILYNQLPYKKQFDFTKYYQKTLKQKKYGDFDQIISLGLNSNIKQRIEFCLLKKNICQIIFKLKKYKQLNNKFPQNISQLNLIKVNQIHQNSTKQNSYQDDFLKQNHSYQKLISKSFIMLLTLAIWILHFLPLLQN